jgi:hypothetical protein
MMTEFTPLAGLAGGALIGIAAVLLMLGFGRIAGLSGIFGGLLTFQFGSEAQWRLIFIAGLLLGAALAAGAGLFEPASLAFAGGPLLTAVAGLIVGIGTALGAGCTSGHGICGLSRLSSRSLAATVTFMAVAILTVFITRHLLGA